MKSGPVLGIDVGVYASAVPRLLRNPSIIVVPLLMAVIGVLLTVVMTPFSSGAIGSMTLGLAQLIQFMLTLFGLGAACIIADDAWRHGHASFERGWVETRRRGSDILMASVGFGLVVTVGLYVTQIIGLLGYLLAAAIVVFLIWTIPAAAVGGIPGGAAIQVSIDRVRSTPLPAVLATIVTLVLVGLVRADRFELAREPAPRVDLRQRAGRASHRGTLASDRARIRRAGDHQDLHRRRLLNPPLVVCSRR